MMCSWESPFANCLYGAPGSDYLCRGIVDSGGAPIADTAFMGLTSCRLITITGKLPRQPAVHNGICGTGAPLPTSACLKRPRFSTSGSNGGAVTAPRHRIRLLPGSSGQDLNTKPTVYHC
jgi:hypothetical protein